MKIKNHILGFPRVGLYRELKKAQEKYWVNASTKQELINLGRHLRKKHWQQQKEAGIDLLPVGDFAWYDHVLTTSLLLGNVPVRHKNPDGLIDIETLFRIARGVAPTGQVTTASEMTKWFNTNYHYIVPEFIKGQQFKLSWMQLFDEIDEALCLGHKVKPVLIGPLTYLWLGKVKGEDFNRLTLLQDLLPVYNKVLLELKKRKITWVQIDEPILTLELPTTWLAAFKHTYEFLYGKLQLILTTYFDSINHNLESIRALPVQGLHIDLACGKYDLLKISKDIPEEWVLSLGIVNGRNVWRTDLIFWYDRLQPIIGKHDLWIGSSCSLLHSPMDLNIETGLDEEVKSWLAFALQKCHEISILSLALNNQDKKILESWSQSIRNRYHSSHVQNARISHKISKITAEDSKRKSNYVKRAKAQKNRLQLPLWPTTTIGSFPQTEEIRCLRRDFKNRKIDSKSYNAGIAEHIKKVISEQERLELDVLVHGEAERNDMVEYFGENLMGFVITDHAWVQSYGSRCVKPPIIIGDISRKYPITLKWTKYAQSLTKKPVKGMLTGPVTMLCWSFVREDISRVTIAKQIALALREEVKDLENAGISIIQIDEPALREGLPLRSSEWKAYLNWAVEAFSLSSSGVSDDTQIHTHMCYGEFSDIMPAIIGLDADVITIETARSDSELLKLFEKFDYPNSIGPGVYDIHSPNIPTIEHIELLLRKAASFIPFERLWVNPDCGLKTRNWTETLMALHHMVQAAKKLRRSTTISSSEKC
ncbi:MAG: 5-methyltetrahydropteroyltriglutamate--homocysteine S-methyltransferase [Candidatus Dasytiphilus stammeri]